MDIETVQWEYRMVSLGEIEILPRLGQAGWEIVSSISYNGGGTEGFVLKRPGKKITVKDHDLTNDLNIKVDDWESNYYKWNEKWDPQNDKDYHAFYKWKHLIRPSFKVKR